MEVSRRLTCRVQGEHAVKVHELEWLQAPAGDGGDRFEALRRVINSIYDDFSYNTRVYKSHKTVEL